MVGVRSGAKVILRKARKGEGPALALLYHRSVRALAAGCYDSDQIEAWAATTTPERAENWIATDEVIVAVQDSRLAGFASLSHSNQTLALLYVDPDFADQGLGRRLARGIERKARAAGIQKLSLRASVNALGFYHRMGYHEHETVIHAIGGTQFRCVLMSKRLGPRPARRSAPVGQGVVR